MIGRQGKMKRKGREEGGRGGRRRKSREEKVVGKEKGNG